MNVATQPIHNRASNAALGRQVSLSAAPANLTKGGSMNRIAFKRGDHTSIPGGSWILLENGQVDVACPTCGKIGRLTHDIASSGDVTPSAGCPQDACEFFAFITLVGWEDP
jgi:hypothetical protein